MTHYDQREDLYAANQARAGHSNDLRTPDAVSAMLTLPVVELPMEVKPMPPAVHAHKVTDSGLMHALTPGGHPSRGPVTPHLTMGPNGQIGEHVDTWPSNEPLKTPLRARLFHDGSLVIDNPARPLVVRPMRPDDMTGHNEELISCELDAEVFIRAALMLSHAKANPSTGVTP